jgi:hypothetical protein
MAQSTTKDDLFTLGANPPWKPSITLAVGFALALHPIISDRPTRRYRLQDLFKAVFTPVASVLAIIDQIAVLRSGLTNAKAG